MQETVLSILAQAAITKYHKLGGLNNKCSFLTVLETGKSKMKVLMRSVSGEGPLSGLQRWPPSCCIFTLWLRGRERERARVRHWEKKRGEKEGEGGRRKGRRGRETEREFKAFLHPRFCPDPRFVPQGHPKFLVYTARKNFIAQQVYKNPLWMMRSFLGFCY